LDIVDGQDRRGAGARGDAVVRSVCTEDRRRRRRPLQIAIGANRHQLVPRPPGVSLFSAAYFAAASLTMGAITESSDVTQSDAIFHFLPSQVWMRPVRVASGSAQDILIGPSSPS